MSADIRWSFDPRTDELDIWDSNDGRISHYNRHGQEGYENCAQGRLRQIMTIGGRRSVLDSIAASIYSDRPFAFGGETEKEAEEVRERAKTALNEHYHPYPVHWQLTF